MIRRTPLLIQLLGTGLLLFGCTKNVETQPLLQNPETPRPFDHEATDTASILRIICDIADRVGSKARMYPGRIDWADASEEFSFKLSAATFDVRLEHALRQGEIFRVFFNVDQDPNFPTKFDSGEWWFRGRVGQGIESGGVVVHCVYLSRFRNADRGPRYMMGH